MKNFLSKLSSLICGVYFIRFALVLWIFPAAISLLDWMTPAAIFTRGILRPESVAQAFSAAFMLVSAGVVALLNARLIAINGHERFPARLPDHDWLRRVVGRRRLPLWLFLVAHAPGLATIGYLEFNMRHEQAHLCESIGFLTLGVLAAYAFWLLVGLIYLWSFDRAHLGGRLPARLIFPNRLVPLSPRQIRHLVSEPPPLLATWLRPLFQFIADIGGPGFANPAGVLYEGHRLAAASINGLLALYIYLFAFTAPVPWHSADVICNLGMLLLALLAAIGAGWGRWPATSAARIVKVVATVFFLAFAVLILCFWSGGMHAPRGFSVLGSVLVLVIGLLWILSTISVGKFVNAGRASFPHEKVQTDAVPAESFLHAFAHDGAHMKLAACARKAYADLPLVTAARMSGTFPYVSSASRIPEQISASGYHFVDGGYFDNDGTSSAIEFLHFAGDALNPTKIPAAKNPAHPPTNPKQHHGTHKPSPPRDAASCQFCSLKSATTSICTPPAAERALRNRAVSNNGRPAAAHGDRLCTCRLCGVLLINWKRPRGFLARRSRQRHAAQPARAVHV